MFFVSFTASQKEAHWNYVLQYVSHFCYDIIILFVYLLVCFFINSYPDKNNKLNNILATMYSNLPFQSPDIREITLWAILMRTA